MDETKDEVKKDRHWKNILKQWELEGRINPEEVAEMTRSIRKAESESMGIAFDF